MKSVPELLLVLAGGLTFKVGTSLVLMERYSTNIRSELTSKTTGDTDCFPDKKNPRWLRH